MNLPKFAVRPLSIWRVVVVCGLLLLPAQVWSEPAAPSLAEQLAQAREAKDDASIVEICRRQLAQSPGDAGALREMFLAQLDLKDCDRAADTLAKLGKAGTPPAVLAEFRGDLAQTADKPLDEALAAWREALAAKPANTPVLLGKIADALDDDGRWADAAEAVRAFLKVKPNHAARTSRLAVCLLNAGHPEDADKQAVAAGKLDSADDTVKANAPMFDRLRPQLSALRKLGDRIAAYKPGKNEPDPRLDRALIYYRAGAYAAALEDVQRITKETAGRSVAARVVQGQCLWRLDQGDEAAALRVAQIGDVRWFDSQPHCDQLRAPDQFTGKESDAAIVRAYAVRTMLFLGSNQPVLALEDAEKAVQAEEKAHHVTADTLLVYSAALLMNDRRSEALTTTQRALDLDPRNSEGWALRGRMEQEVANFPAAVENLTRALALEERAGWLRRREQCLRAMGQNAEADRDSKRIAQLTASS